MSTTRYQSAVSYTHLDVYKRQVQVSVKILTSVDTAPALSERAMRQFTLRHSPEGIVIEQIRTDGLGYAEASGWSVAVSASA